MLQLFLVAMAKTAVLMVIITSLIMTQSITVKGSLNINYNQDRRDHVENAAQAHDRTFEQGLIRAKLKVKGYAINLADLDGWTAGRSDPYMEVVATDITGYTEKHTSPVRGGTSHPEWNDYLVFSERTWEKMTVRIMDYDGANRDPDQLCPTQDSEFILDRHPMQNLTAILERQASNTHFKCRLCDQSNSNC